jgi:uncharacterized protein YbjT (DUF2867 family)
MTVLVTGASGTVGHPLLTRLADDGVPTRAVVHRSASATALAQRNLAGVEVVRADLADVGATGALVEGMAAVFLVTANVDGQLAQEQAVIRAAVAGKVGRIVKISVGGAAPDAPLSLARVHYAAEQDLIASGIPHTVVRPSFFMDNLLQYIPWVDPSGQLALPMGEAAMAMIDARDIADVAATELTDSSAENRELVLTGGEDLTMSHALTRIGEVTGATLTYLDSTREQFVARYRADGNSPDYTEDIATLYDTILRAGYGAGITTTVEEVTGHPPRTITDFARHHRTAFTR